MTNPLTFDEIPTALSNPAAAFRCIIHSQPSTAPTRPDKTACMVQVAMLVTGNDHSPRDCSIVAFRGHVRTLHQPLHIQLERPNDTQPRSTP